MLISSDLSPHQLQEKKNLGGDEGWLFSTATPKGESLHFWHILRNWFSVSFRHWMNTLIPPIKTYTDFWVKCEPPFSFNILYVSLTLPGDRNARLVQTIAVFRKYFLKVVSIYDCSLSICIIPIQSGINTVLACKKLY